jgi:hypothetical protein
VNICSEREGGFKVSLFGLGIASLQIGNICMTKSANPEIV